MNITLPIPISSFNIKLDKLGGVNADLLSEAGENIRNIKGVNSKNVPEDVEYVLLNMSHVLNSASGNGALAGTKSVGYSNPELIGEVSIAEAYKILKAEALVQAGYYDPTVKDSIVKILQNTATMNTIINVNESIKAVK
tara:strand:- start:50 stop:466 length:417 start_codon:yes stop_codon:yes gene_type:complete